MQDIVDFHRSKFAASDDARDHWRLIAAIVGLHSEACQAGAPRMISSIQDIPGYAARKKGRRHSPGYLLDPDLEPVVREPWKDDTEIDRGYLSYVTYTYHSVGGSVKRYKVRFNSVSRDAEGRFREWAVSRASETILGRGIGDFAGRK